MKKYLNQKIIKVKKGFNFVRIQCKFARINRRTERFYHFYEEKELYGDVAVRVVKKHQRKQNRIGVAND